MEPVFKRQWPPCVEVIDDRIAEGLRRMSTVRKMELANEFFFFVQEVGKSGIRSQHPEWTAEQVDREWIRRLDPWAQETSSSW